jgi:hypothetical protein
MMRSPLVLVWCWIAATAEPSPDNLIQQATERVLTSAARIPNYTCIESVLRDYYWPRVATLPRSCPVLMEQRRHPTPDLALRLAVTDLLRLDVTMTDRGEIFSWAGASRFNDAGLDQIVNGPIGTGAFGAFLAVIFKQDVQKFTFEGSREVDGRTLIEYSFHVPPTRSSYKIHIPDGPWVRAGYRGSALVDSATANVVRLSVLADELPTATNLCQISTNLALEMIKIGDGEFLLPARAQERYVVVNGDETEISTSFSRCREYKGESNISFTVTDAGSGGSLSASHAPARVPPQSFTFELTAPIISSTAAAGDEFVGRLDTPVRDDRRRKLAQVGSLVKGHLLRIERHHLAPPFTVVVMKPERVEVGNTVLSLAAMRDWSRELAQSRRGKAGPEISLPLPSEKNVGVFRFTGDTAIVPRGFRTDWRAVDMQAH